MPSSRPARSQGFSPDSAGAGGGAVSRRNCSIAAEIAAASSGVALEPLSSMRGRGGVRWPLPDTLSTVSPAILWPVSELSDRLLRHAEALARDGRSPLYESLMRGAAADPEVLAVVFPEGPGTEGSVPALRLMAALHHVVLTGRAPGLARHFPSAGGGEGPECAWDAAREAIEADLDEVRRLAARTVQTNEPGRCATLYGGLLRLAERHGLPLRLLEIGASAGLTLLPDRYRYVVQGRPLGDPESPLAWEEPWVGLPVADPWAAESSLRIAERRASDISPLDVSTEEGAATALSYIWPDEPERLARVRLAIEIQRGQPVVLERAGAAYWVDARLREPGEGVVTVIWESVMRQYMDEAERAELERQIEGAGERAGEGNPLAWVMLDASGGDLSNFQLSCRAWPGGDHEVWADTGYHGPPVRWR